MFLCRRELTLEVGGTTLYFLVPALGFWFFDLFLRIAGFWFFILFLIRGIFWFFILFLMLALRL